jgi:amino acid adenylation domain-containing protein/thioester reductase-like protein
MDGVKYYPLTHPQKGIWYTEKLYPGTSIGTISATLRLKDEVDYPILEKAINIFIEKNDGARLRFVETDHEPVQYVSAYRYVKLDFYDFSGDSIEKLYKWDEEQTRLPFSLTDSDLFYFALIKIGDRDGGFLVKMHHLISDAWTMSIVGNSIVEYYYALKNGVSIDAGKKPAYPDYIIKEEEYRNSSRFEADRQYWNEKLDNWSEVTSLKVRKTNEQSTRARRKTFLIPKKLTAKIREYCSEKGLSEYVLFFAALSMYINRVTAKEDLILGTTLLNRSNIKDKNTVGMFTSTAVPTRISIRGDMNFRTFAEYISKEIMSVMRHQRYPYDLMAKRVREQNRVSTAIFDIVLSFQNSKFTNAGGNAGKYTTRWHFSGHQIESLLININDRDNDGRLIIDYDYLTDLFYATEIEFIHQHIINLLWHALDNPEKSISRLEMLSEQEKHKILHDFNDTKADFPHNKTLQQLFEEQAEKTPDSTAVIFNDEYLTYRELNERANSLAATLRLKGLGPDRIAGIMAYRSLEMVVGIFGIIKAGGAYMPIDPQYPEDRIKYMLEDSKAELLLTQEPLMGALPFDGCIINLNDQNSYSYCAGNVENLNRPEDLAYIIYTSGSTSMPKGVMIEHRSVINRLNWMQKKYPIGKGSCILQKTPFTFDVSVWELFWWSFAGASVCMLEPGGERDPESIIGAVEKYGITTLHFVPSMLNMFLQYLEEQANISRLSSLRQVFSSGEALSIQLVRKFNNLVNAANGAELYNLYGPTEATVDVSYFDCSPEVGLNLVPIGRPIDNIKLYILDKNMVLLPVGIPGELFIGGVGVARGYLNKPELTRERFIENPFIPGERIYKTGDLARWFSRGDIEYLGRMDFQIKIRGFRIEPGEIENRLLAHPGVSDAVVVGRNGKNGDKYLCAYYSGEKDVSVGELRAHLSKELPEYMVPKYIFRLENLPLSSNGKINRKALPEYDASSADIRAEYAAPADDIEKKLVSVCSEVLRLGRLGVNDNLFDLGADSLTVINILTGIYKYNWGLSAADFYKYKTIAGLSQKIRGTIQCESEASRLDIVSIDPGDEASFSRRGPVKLGRVLLTGATGFLGSHILSELLENTDAVVYCIVRAKNLIYAQERFIKLLRYYFGNKYGDLIGKRIRILNGDITSDGFGLSEDEFGEIAEGIDTVINSAALVKYFGDYSEFEKVNVKGADRLIEFCRQYGKTFVHISTLAVAGSYLVGYSGENVKYDENSFYVGQNYTENVYVRSKFEAENLVLAAMKKGLDAMIFRMGNLTGRYSDGHFQPNMKENAFYNTIKSIYRLGVIPMNLLDQDVEFTPVEYAADALIRILKTEARRNRIFHILNHKELKLGRVLEIFRQLCIDVKVVGSGEFGRYVENIARNRAKVETLSGIIADMSKSRELSYKAAVETESRLTGELLASIGFEWPEINKNYILKIIKFMESAGFLSGEDILVNEYEEGYQMRGPV